VRTRNYTGLGMFNHSVQIHRIRLGQNEIYPATQFVSKRLECGAWSRVGTLLSYVEVTLGAITAQSVALSSVEAVRVQALQRPSIRAPFVAAASPSQIDLLPLQYLTCRRREVRH
jgi:hypothetical protein